MELSDHLRDPVSAALIAAGITADYIHLKAYLNNEGKLEMNMARVSFMCMSLTNTQNPLYSMRF